MPRKIDMIGKTYGQLTVVSELPTRSNSGRVMYRCRCSCGNWSPAVLGSNIRRGLTTSCGSNKHRKKHGMSDMSGNSHYQRWCGIKQRTGNPNDRNYHHYGGRGITMYGPWRDSFVLFKNWIDKYLGPCPEGFSLDRIDNDKGYAPHNIRWASAKTQNNNRRKVI